MRELITVLTPTYNRGHLLEKCYISLINQTSKEFIWLIIDDGSTDNTFSIVQKWITENKIKIRYEYKTNGGKHTALNYAFEMLDTDLTFIVDSDDVLSSDAISTIQNDWNTYGNNSLSGISYLRGYSFKRVIGTEFPQSYFIYNDIDIHYKKHVTGDKAEIWRTDILKKYRFPEYHNEKFQGENFIWWQIALEYDMLYVNKIIYITEYLEGGLTKSGKKLRINCPLGGMDNSKIGFNNRFPLKERLKRGILYNCYRFFSKRNFRFALNNSDKHYFLVLITYLPGGLLYIYWKQKYMKGD